MNKKRIAIITGGAGGIGRHISRLMAERDLLVIVADRDPEDSKRTAAALGGSWAGSHIGIGADLSTAEGVDEVISAAQSGGELQVLVNALGISPKTEGRQSTLADIDAHTWDLVMAVNLRGPFLMSRAAYPAMVDDGSASIVNIHSIGGALGAGGGPDVEFPPHYAIGAHYAASKAALQNLTVSMSRELAPRRIRVNGVAPGFVATEMTAVMPEADKQTAVRQVPLGRFAEPQEIARTVDFLVSDAASYITGASINATGGWLTD